MRGCLRRKAVTTIGHLIDKTADQLYWEAPGLGRYSVMVIEGALARKDLRLRGGE